MNNKVNILGIETSCDETGIAVINGKNFQFFPSQGSAGAEIYNFQTSKEDIINNGQNVGAQNFVSNGMDFGFEILAEGLASSVDLQKEYGGVVPELASRVHVEKINLLLTKCLHEAKLDWDEIDAIAVANGPGLVGSLLVGTMVAKTLGMVLGKPLISVNHLEGHICSAFLAEKAGISNSNKFSISNDQKNNVGAGFTPDQINNDIFPMLVLIVSGGHTELLIMRDFGEYEMLGSTVDDAAGEAFDKAAKILGLEYPGGPSIAKRASQCNFQFFPSRGSAAAEISSFQTCKEDIKKKNQKNNVEADLCVRPNADNKDISVRMKNFVPDGDFFELPRPMIDSNDWRFSFSGLKTALLYKWKEISNFSPHGDQLVPKFPISPPQDRLLPTKKFPISDFQTGLINRMAYEFQEAVVDVLVTKTVKAAEKFDIDKVAIVGGVAANGRLREEMEIRLKKIGRQLIVPPIKYCTDNGVKIAVAGYFKYLKNDFTDWKKLEVNSNWEL